MVCILAISRVVCAYEGYTVSIDAPGNVQGLLQQFLQIGRWQTSTDISSEQLQQLIQSVPDETGDLLATQGYFSPRVMTRLEESGSVRTVYISVEPGPQTEVSSVNIDITGTVTQDKQFEQYQKEIRRAWPLRRNRVFTQSDWDTSKRAGVQILSREKYARARLTHSEARITPETQQAELTASYDSGPLYTIGDVHITGLSRYPEKMVRQQIHLNKGESYSQDKLFALQSTLQNFPHFTSAIVAVDFANEQQIDSDHIEAPIIVNVQEAPIQKLGAGIGYGSDNGTRGELRYQYNNVADRGWVLSTDAKADRVEQYGMVTLTVPKRGSGYDDSFYIKYKKNDIQNLFSRQQSVGAQRTRKKGRIETALVLEYTKETQRFDDGSQENPRALVLNYKWIRRDLDDISNPRSGNMVWLEAGGAAKGVASDTSFFRLYGTGMLYWRLGRKDTIITRIQAGQVFATDEMQVPSDWLFRAGGSNSVRGYNYQSLGVKRRGSVVGGRVLGTGTVEYQHTVYRGWRAAVFADAGDAAQNWQEYKLHPGAGFGARWASPVGVFGSDLAYGFDDNKWRFYISMGLMF